jgi:CRISPR-associated exonuclease Cas4
VWSDAQHLRGVCDVVKFHKDGRIIPIEYKRGRPKSHRADEIQICAQAICLEENFDREAGSIASGFLFYGKQQRRTQVSFDTTLRELTLSIADSVRSMLQKEVTPPASFSSQRCGRCSLIHLCQPKSMRLKRGVSDWFTQQLESQI